MCSRSLHCLVHRLSVNTGTLYSQRVQGTNKFDTGSEPLPINIVNQFYVIVRFIQMSVLEMWFH